MRCDATQTVLVGISRNTEYSCLLLSEGRILSETKCTQFDMRPFLNMKISFPFFNSK